MSDSSNSFWQALPALKERQRRTGLLAALVLGLAVLVLVDGLQALMRAGSYHLDIVAGQGTMLSGPIGIDKPRDSDLLVSVTPEGAPLSFRLDGFFASYWFGNGMVARRDRGGAGGHSRHLCPERPGARHTGQRHAAL